MRALLLGLAAPLAALAVPAAPAGAQSSASTPPATVPAGPFDRWAAAPSGPGDFVRIHRDGKRHDRRRHRRSGDTVVIGGPVWNEAWALYNNRTFDPDSFNDWWHERPWRSYPRWVREAPPTDCDRMWWGGGAWRCSW